MEMAGKQFSPFMEMVVQPCLTSHATTSYSLSNCVLRFMEMASKQFSPFMEMVVQPCLTACATVSYNLCNWSYGLWKWLASSSSIYGNGFRSGTSENQRLHKKLGNSEIRLHTDLGNSELKKLHLNKNWWNCDRNLRQSAPIGKKLRRNSAS